MKRVTKIAVLLAACTSFAVAGAQTCGGFRSVDAALVEGWCLSAVASQSDGLKMPRTVLWLGRSGSVDQLLIVDMGSWEPRRGRLLLLSVDRLSATVQTRELLAGLDRPHGLRRAADGKIYLGEATRVSRFVWNASVPVLLETVIDNLPADGRHPLKEIAFGPDGSLYVNVGAATDRCEREAKIATSGMPTCPEMESPQPQAAVYRITFDKPGGKVATVKPFAIGLRNSMALVVHSSGTVLQAENNVDFPDENFPPEEINRLVEGGHYGWPGCSGLRQPLAGFTARACAGTRAPEMLMPAHAAPLHMQYSFVAFGAPPATSSNGLLMSWHGYRAAGQKLVRYSVGDHGIPVGPPQFLIQKWTVAEGKGSIRPGAPVGWSEDADGSLWIADDRNRMLVWFHRKPLR